MVNKKKAISLILVLGIIIDQIAKYLVRFYNPNIDFGFFSIVLAKNTGSAFSLFRGKTFILIIISVIFISLFLFYYKKIILEEDYYAYFLILAGAIGNLIDRLFLGFVTDMISVGSFPVFNIADSMITIGAIIIIYNVILEEIIKRKKSKR